MGILSSVVLPASGSSVTVPSGAQVAVLLYAYWTASTPASAATASIGGQSFSSRALYPGNGSDAAVTGVQTAVVSGSGSQTFSISYSGATAEGPVGALIFIDGTDTGDFYRASDADASPDAGSAVSSSCAMEATDIVLGLDGAYSSAPPNETGWTSLVTQSNNSRDSRARNLTTPSSGTATINAQSPNYSTTTIISIKQTGGGGGGIVKRQLMMGVGV